MNLQNISPSQLYSHLPVIIMPFNGIPFSAQAFYEQGSPIPGLMELVPVYEKINEDRFYVQKSRHRRSFDDAELKVLRDCDAYITNRLALPASSATQNLAGEVLTSLEAQRKLWTDLRDRLREVHSQASKTETMYGPTRTRVPIQWLANEETQKSPVDSIPVLLLQIYEAFKHEQPLWARYIESGEEGEFDTQSESENEATDDPLSIKVQEFLDVVGSDQSIRDICVSLVRNECESEDVGTEIRRVGGVTEASEESGLQRFDEMAGQLSKVQSSVKTALSKNNEQKLPTCLPQ